MTAYAVGSVATRPHCGFFSAINYSCRRTPLPTFFNHRVEVWTIWKQQDVTLEQIDCFFIKLWRYCWLKRYKWAKFHQFTPILICLLRTNVYGSSISMKHGVYLGITGGVVYMHRPIWYVFSIYACSRYISLIMHKTVSLNHHCPPGLLLKDNFTQHK